MTSAHGVPRLANQTMLPASRPVAWASQPTRAAARPEMRVIDETGLFAARETRRRSRAGGPRQRGWT